ncbi:MAG: phosphotransferase [Propionibacteriaceae bacterium]
MPFPADEDRTPVPEVLYGGVANAGLVLRVGDEVWRPAGPHSASITAFLRYLRTTGFDGASSPIVTVDGQERMVFVPGDVAIPPYPDWAQTEEALRSVTRLLRRLHEAAVGYGPAGSASWSHEMADPDLRAGEPWVVCHNDVCLENVVFREGEAVALLDFDFAAPGRPIYDLARLAQLCVPLDHDPGRLGWRAPDPAGRLAAIAEAYGLDHDGRAEFFAALSAGMARGGLFVQRQVERGNANFIAMWESMGGMAHFDRRREWWADRAPEFRRALGLEADQRSD